MSELGLKVFAGAEFHALGSFDLNLVACLRVHSRAGFTIDDFESAEADKLDHFGFFQAAFDSVDHCCDDAFGFCLAGVCTEGFLNGRDEFCFVHRGNVMRMVGLVG